MVKINNKLIKIEDTGWIDLPFADGFRRESFGYGPQIRKINNVVYMRGIARKENGNINQGDAPLNPLPTIFRPQQVMYFQLRTTAGMTISCQINSNGAFLVSLNATTGTGPYISFDGINYIVD